MKPYRCINASELQKLTAYFAVLIQSWNEEYAVRELQFQLRLAPPRYPKTNAALLGKHALIDGDYLSLMNEVLFTQQARSYHSVSNTLFMLLLNQFFNSEYTDIKTFGTIPEWCYLGSTALLLELRCSDKELRILLSPDWVYEQLPQINSNSNHINSLDEALNDQLIPVHLELISSQLNLKSLTTMQVGDVIATQHPLSLALKLYCKNAFIAHAELGQSLDHKSIRLKELL